MLTYPQIDPIIFSLGFVKIRWYGLMYVIGFLAGWWLARKRAANSWSVIKPEQVDDLIFYAMLGVIVGARLGYCLVYGWENLLTDPLYIFKITEGGMSFHGGLVGVMTAMWMFGQLPPVPQQAIEAGRMRKFGRIAKAAEIPIETFCDFLAGVGQYRVRHLKLAGPGGGFEATENVGQLLALRTYVIKVAGVILGNPSD